MDLALAGKTALVTGGGRGIGRAIALALAEEGVDVAIASRVPEPETTREIAAHGVRSIGIEADVSSEPQVEAMVAHAIDAFGHLDLFVNNAGHHWHEPVTGITTQNWRRTIDTNLSACVWACRDVARHMVARRQGSILVVASVIQFHPAYGEGAYRVSKVGLKAYAETLAIELAPFNIRVNVLSPGLFPTRLGSNLTHALRDPVLSRTIIEWVPMRRVGDPAECGAAAAFLLSDRVASYITGADVVVDGGFKLRPRAPFRDGEAGTEPTPDGEGMP